MTIKEIFIVQYGVLRAELQDITVSVGPAQLAQPGLRDLLQHPPHHLVPHPAHVELDSPVEEPGLQDLVGGGGARPPLRGDQGPAEAWQDERMRCDVISDSDPPCILV